MNIDIGKVRLPNFLLTIAMLACFVTAAHIPKDRDPGPLLTIVLGILLLRRAIVLAPQPAVVVISGCFLAAAVIASDRGLVNCNAPLWIVLVLVGFGCYGFWERVEKLWRKPDQS